MHTHEAYELKHIHPERRDTGEYIGTEAFSLDPFAGEKYRDKPIFSADEAGAYLNRTEWDWYTNNYDVLGGTDRVLTFGFWNNFRDLANSYYLNDAGDTGFSEVNINTFSVFTEAQRVVARQSMQLWDDLVSISFQEVSSAAASDLAFGNTDTGGAQAYAYLPFGDIFDADYKEDFGSDWQVGKLSGDVWIDGFVASNFFPLGPSYYGYTTMIHEIGHGLGLSHPGDYDALDDSDGDGEPDPISYGNDAVYAQDSLQYSIMSYWDAYETGAQHIDWTLLNFAYAATPLVHDVVGIQAIYGVDTLTRTGDTVYGFNSTAGRAAYDFTVNTRPVVTIWDAGGKDTIDFSGWNTPSTIDLNEGAFSSGGGSEEFLTLEQVNANRAALGFAARTQATFDFYESLKNALGLTDGLFKDNVSIAYGAVIENAVGGGGDDRLIGNAAANRLTGNAGQDLLVGALGADTLLGGAGVDWLEGGAGADTLTGGADKDVFFFAKDLAGARDRVTDFGADDFLVTTVAFRDGNRDNIIAASRNKVFDFTQGGSVAVTGSSGAAVTSLRFDGVFTEDGVQYFVYSLNGGNALADFTALPGQYEFP